MNLTNNQRSALNKLLGGATIRTRTDTICSDCGRMRHRTCATCGAKNLIGYKGQQGLFDHITSNHHTCKGAYFDQDDSGNGGDDMISGTDNTRGEPDLGEGGRSAASSYTMAEMEMEGDGDGQGSAPPIKFIAITGRLSVLRNEFMNEMTEKYGIQEHAYVSTTTQIVVEGAVDNPASTAKLNKARDLGIPIMSEQDFRDMMAGGGEGEGEGEGEEGEDDPLMRELAEALNPYRKIINGFDIDKLKNQVGATVDKKLDTALSDMTKATEQAKEEIEQAIEEMKASTVVQIEVKMPDGTTVTVPGAHKQMGTLLRLVQARQNVYIVGPTGSGKTKAGEQVSEAVGLRFFPKSVGPTTTAFDMMGYMNAAGDFVPGIMYEPFVNGGLLLIDEMDSGNPTCQTSLGTALANRYCSFPNGVADRHPDSVFLASGNTFGKGADRMYVGRNQLDESTRNRFSFLIWDYDTALELRLAEEKAKLSGQPEVMKWAHRVHNIRESSDRNKLRFIASTRDILDGADLIIHGFTMREVEDLRFWNAADEDVKQRIFAEVGETAP